MGQQVIRCEKLGVRQSTRVVFILLATGSWIDTTLTGQLKRMALFPNIAVHDYQVLQLPITASIIETHFDKFLHNGKPLLLRDAATPVASRCGFGTEKLL